MSNVTGHYFERITPENSVLVLLDHQTGIMQGVADFTAAEFRNNVLALARVGQMFDLPTVLTTSFEEGPNGPFLPEVRAMFPKAPYIPRPGQINAWDYEEFVAAIKATGRTKLIMAGVTTDVCLLFPALSACKQGYDVRAVIDCSGTWNQAVQNVSISRMVQAGVIPTTWVSVSAELQGDWRRSTGQALGQLFHDRLPFYGNLQANFMAAKGNLA